MSLDPEQRAFLLGAKLRALATDLGLSLAGDPVALGGGAAIVDAGTVVALGSGTTGLTIGDEVFGTADGSFAEYAVADASALARIPNGIDMVHAAGRPVLVGTARPVTMRRLRPATRTMKNSSRLSAEIDRKRSLSSSGCLELRASSRTRQLN